MLLTGRPLFRIDEKLLRDPTWPSSFAKADYTTFISGKWHNGPASLPKSFQIGHSIFVGGMTNPMKAKLSNMADGKLTPPQLAPKHACEVFADETIRFLKEHKEGPFFCYVAFDAPHDPHVVPDGFPIKYDPAAMPLRPNYLPQHPWDNGEMLVRDEQLLPWPRPPEKVRKMNADYYRYISYLDSQIGRILDELDASPYANDTFVVFSADSGVAREPRPHRQAECLRAFGARAAAHQRSRHPRRQTDRRHVLSVRCPADAREVVQRDGAEDE